MYKHSRMLLLFLTTIAVSAATPRITTEQKMNLKYPKFDGNGYLELPKLNNPKNKLDITMKFRPNSFEGLLLFSAQTTKADKDFLSVVLNGGFVVFRFDCGTGLGELKSAYRVKLNVWNNLVITLSGKNGTLKLNNEQTVHGQSQGNHVHISFNLNLFVGGYNNMSAISRRIATTDQFVGCVKELLINGREMDFRKKGESLQGRVLFERNVGECDTTVCDGVVCENGGTCTPTSADAFLCVCPMGFYGDTCRLIQSVPVPQFSGNSYLRFPGLKMLAFTNTFIEIVFKPNHGDGLLFYDGYFGNVKGDYISLSLRGGFLEFRFDLGGGPAVLRSPRPLTLRSWHRVRAYRTGRKGQLRIDDQAILVGQSKGYFVHLILFGDLYIGGHSNSDQTAKLHNLTKSFSGCIQKVIVNDIRLDLVSGATSRINITPCSESCNGTLCSNEQLYRKFLYQISGKFGNVKTRPFPNSRLPIAGSLSKELYVKPINTTLFPNKETFYVKHNLIDGKVESFLMTLQYNRDRLVLLERHYFLPYVVVPDERNGSTFFENLSLSFFDTSRNKCGGTIYLIDSSSIETVGSLNMCELDGKDPPQYNIDITCNKLLLFGNSHGNYTDLTITSKERLEFPPGWSVNPC